ncbi:MAG TPA: hypothetical protein VFR09_03125 [Alphaproteobacteria bacterium]|nr:hypothetical protein [Alphaproteobacteria bacterium]
MRKHTCLILTLFLAACFAFATAKAEDSTPQMSVSYFPVLPYGAAPDAAPQLLPVASNHPFEGEHAGLTKAVIVIHDTSRDARATLAMISGLAGPENTTTMILAPQFLEDADLARFGGELPDNGKMFARWPLDGWQVGGDSVAQGQGKGISSFTALDLLLLYLGEKKFFPDLTQVVIAGHGAGGDFVQRYAALGQAPDILDQQHVNVRFIAANPSSYLYFTAARAQGGKQGFTTPDAAQCPVYNSYPYGLDSMNAYGHRVGPDAVRLRYITRNIYYLAGENAAKGDLLADTGCAAMLEGADRVNRTVNYDLYLTVAFGDAAHKLQKFRTVPKVGFQPAPVFASACGMAALFGDGECM